VDLFDLTGKVAVVTGGTRGIGLMMARGLLQAGASVYISSRKPEAGQAAVEVVLDGGEADAGLDASGDPLARGNERDRCRRRAGRRDLNPAAAAGGRHVKALGEAELADVELQRPVLVGDRNTDRPDAGDPGPGFRFWHF